MAVRCSNNPDKYWISKVIQVSDTVLVTHAHGSFNRRLRSATFRPIYVDPRDNTKMVQVPHGKLPDGTPLTKENTAWTDTLPPQVLPRFIVASHLTILASGKLSALSLDTLDRLPGTITVASLSD